MRALFFRIRVENFCVDSKLFPLEAFDTVNHQILLQKLYWYEIRGVPLQSLQWFKSILKAEHSMFKLKMLKELTHDNAHVWVLTVADCY